MAMGGESSVLITSSPSEYIITSWRVTDINEQNTTRMLLIIVSTVV